MEEMHPGGKQSDEEETGGGEPAEVPHAARVFSLPSSGTRFWDFGQ